MLKLIKCKTMSVLKGKRTKEEEFEICPHCNEEIREKSTYWDGSDWFHRPCISKGPIKRELKNGW